MLVIALPLSSKDWGEANRNPMVRAYGKKRGKKAKCKSCACFFKSEGVYTCKYRYPVEHSESYVACCKYINKKGGTQHE
ncbi:hypothetical protein AWH56_008940 [Anaerobacillus isosaccharinicus]|uniref:Uncharacterized protein n=1 Tax=Anaerobacillus isosaccharinicus TaxID=1532552 RepID=A0A1S2KYA1_9BACI|nr:hypothetical protein [Anaerobacillus isosaccharinicus]QOY37687.1 hypothetical protein AWH56_008940 [Anaerobacillus isosaccharinicus]